MERLQKFFNCILILLFVLSNIPKNVAVRISNSQQRIKGKK